MKRKVLSLLLYGVSLAIIGWLAGFQLRYFTSLPDVTEFYQPAGVNSGVSTERLEALQDAILVSGSSFSRGQVSTGSGKAAYVQLLYTDRFYKTLYQPSMKAGGFWTTDGAVISDRLASQLFLGADCVGAVLTCGPVSYEITGVYELKEDFSTSAAPLPDVILPLQQSTVEMVTFSGSQPASYYLGLVQDAGLSQLGSWTAVRLRPEANFLLLLDQWVILFGWMFFFWRFIRWLTRRGSVLAADLKKSFAVSYGREALWQNRAALLQLTAALVFAGILSGVVLRYATVQLLLPTDTFVDNIFSLSQWSGFLGNKINRPLQLADPAMATALFQLIWTTVMTVVALPVAIAAALAGKWTGCKNH